MSTSQFPTSKDISFQIDGKKVAIVQSYSTSYSNDDREVDAFGEEEPVGFVPGKKQYSIRISKAYMDDEAIADGMDFYNLRNFNFVISKPDRKIVYSGCFIQTVDEEGSLNDIVMENVTIKATKRDVERL